MDHGHADIKHLAACILYLVLNSQNKKLQDILTDSDLKLACRAVARSIVYISSIQGDSSETEVSAAARCFLSLLG